MKRFVIKTIETCPECQGTKWVSDPTGFWTELQEHEKTREAGRLAPDEFDAYVAERGYDPKGLLPPEEAPCGWCEGTGELVGEVSLEEALASLKAGGEP